jgi:hypothetical protein
MMNPPEATEDNKQEKNKQHPDVDLQHTFNYVGGAFAFKNSKKKREIIDPKNEEKSVLITGYGKARPVSVNKPELDPRAGVYPKHNSPEDFKLELEVLESKSFESYQNLSDVEKIKAKGYKHKVVSITKERLNEIYEQFSHLSIYAFNQMMCINAPDKRDFDVWYKTNKKTGQSVVIYPHSQTGLSQFIQVIEKNKAGEVRSVKHSVFDNGVPILVNETSLDKFDNIRQIAHVGAKPGSIIKNAVERFDDGTVIWTVTKENESGSAALKLNGEIIVVGEELNDLNMLAAKNLGAEGILNDGTWTGAFSLEGCLAKDHPEQQEYKESARKQVGQVIDSATIPGLKPIFPV